MTPKYVIGSGGASSETRNIARGRVVKAETASPSASPSPTRPALSADHLQTARPSAPSAIRADLASPAAHEKRENAIEADRGERQPQSAAPPRSPHRCGWEAWRTSAALRMALTSMRGRIEPAQLLRYFANSTRRRRRPTSSRSASAPVRRSLCVGRVHRQGHVLPKREVLAVGRMPTTVMGASGSERCSGKCGPTFGRRRAGAPGSSKMATSGDPFRSEARTRAP